MIKKETFLSTQGYKGTRDFYPELQSQKNWLYDNIRRSLTSFGYCEYNGPLLEHIELYASKTSEEIVREQLYSFFDKGERHVAIRPEMTPTVARMVAAKQNELPKPIRWFSIASFMRFERPQRGRLREFDQVNVDLFGGDALDEDLEIILTGVQILKNLGATYSDFKVKINHRRLVNDYFSQVLQLNSEKAELKKSLLRLIDKIDKITPEEFRTECLKLGLLENEVNALEEFFHSSLENIIAKIPEPHVSILDFQKTIDELQKLTSTEIIEFCPRIMRGFEYYTGIIFEYYDVSEENRRALFGGGRYDDLVGSFGAQPMSGVGFALGDVTMMQFLETHKLLPQEKSFVDVAVIRFGEQDRSSALELAQFLRAHTPLKISAPLSNIKFGKQIQQAERAKAKAVVFRGEEEMKKNSFTAKWLSLGQQSEYSFSKEGITLFQNDFINLRDQ